MTQSINLTSNPSFFIEEGFKEIFGENSIVLSEIRETLTAEQSLESRESIIHTLGRTEIKGLFIRAGRAAFHSWLDSYSSSMGWEKIEFRLLPPALRIQEALLNFFTWLKEEFQLRVELETSARKWVIGVHFSEKGKSLMDCRFVLGMFQELVCWAGGGKSFPAREVNCQSDGAGLCVFEIDRQPAN
jgi:hypothetical protein